MEAEPYTIGGAILAALGIFGGFLKRKDLKSFFPKSASSKLAENYENQIKDLKEDKTKLQDTIKQKDEEILNMARMLIKRGRYDDYLKKSGGDSKGDS